MLYIIVIQSLNEMMDIQESVYIQDFSASNS